MCGTKAAFAERAIQLLKDIIYRYIDSHGEKFNFKLPGLQGSEEKRKFEPIHIESVLYQRFGDMVVMNNKNRECLGAQALKFMCQ